MTPREGDNWPKVTMAAPGRPRRSGWGSVKISECQVLPSGRAGEPGFRHGWTRRCLCLSVFLCRLSFHVGSSVNTPWGWGAGAGSRTYTLCTEMGVLRFPQETGVLAMQSQEKSSNRTPTLSGRRPPTGSSAVWGSLQDMRQF